MGHKLAAALVATLCLGTPLAAQDAAAPLPATQPAPLPATLIADNIRFDGGTTVTARGAVEVFFDGARLRAASISYDGAGDRLVVEGPLSLTDASGDTVIVADFAELSADLRDGVLQSARLVLDRQLQIAATQIDRSDGRFTQLYQAVASSCEVCFDNPTPLWEIRARRIVHDAREQQLYFENAQFRVLGVPVFFLPRMRLPDPTLARATGFLAPSIRADDRTGTQLRVPYFVRLGDHADLTVTPWIGPVSQTLEARYRQAFRNGEIALQGAASWDDLTTDDTRAYLFGTGRFELPADFILDLQVQAVSDRGYLTTYDFTGTDLLESFVRLSRVRRDEYVELQGTLYQSLRDGEDNDLLPTRTAHAQITRRIVPPLIGGVLSAELEGSGLYRFSTEEATAASANGRDVFRVAGELDWSRTEIFGGLETTFRTALHGAIHSTQQGGALNGTETRLTPYGAVELRYPLQAVSGAGVSHVIEPVVQLVWSETYGNAVPNEDSFIVEFDEGNLFALDRFPGSDLREVGPRANVGLSYSRIAPSGWTLGAAGGLVFRSDEQNQLTEGSGLDGVRSDLLLAGHLGYGDDLNLIYRSLFDEGLDFTSAEVSLAWSGARHDLVTSYTYLESDLGELRPRDLSEWTMDASYGLTSGWEAGVNWRYDFIDAGPTRAGLSLGFENECVDMEFSVSRRYTSSAALEPATSFGFTVSLAGFGAGREGRSTARSCRG